MSETWELGEFNEHLGYDCMTAGIRVGRVYLDGADYGQQRCKPMAEEAKARMMADAHLVYAAPELLEVTKLLAGFAEDASTLDYNEDRVLSWISLVASKARAAISKAEGGAA